MHITIVIYNIISQESTAKLVNEWPTSYAYNSIDHVNNINIDSSVTR